MHSCVPSALEATEMSTTRPGLSKRLLSSWAEARCAAKYFLPDPIPESVVRQVLAATLRAPSSFNFQPWACVIVRSAAQKDALAPAMLGHNATRMKIAPLTAIFCADVTPSARADAVRRNHAAAGLAPSVSDNIVKLMQGYSGDDGSGVDSARARGTEAWAFKMTGFAAQTYLLGMAAHGIATAPMEGFDAEAVSAALGIPTRFKPIVAIVTGYDDPEKRPAKPSWRFTPNEMFYQDTFGKPVPGLEP
eukprot:TRINITY_DN165_c0_g1_i4.p2 TRINITY_DN165_c0_g1~~TRINITY_DN165_c0_g1_i4.p2  ORF type:complete len:248 (+),score=81.30 TRINITY_DN165_c0_g1_i4:324-1067(+)